MTDPAIVDKLQNIFHNKFKDPKFRDIDGFFDNNAWVDYMNQLDATLLTSGELGDEFADMINNEMFFKKKWVCLYDPRSLVRPLERPDFILLEKNFAEKVVSLGGLP